MRRRAARGQRVESSFDAEIDALQIAKQRLADDRKRARKVLMNAFIACESTRTALMNPSIASDSTIGGY